MLHAFAKAAGTALLAVTSGKMLLYYMLGDHALHFLYRVARRDILQYVLIPSPWCYLVSSVMHVLNKVQHDFTGSPAHMTPLIMGGRYCLFNMISSQASVFVAVPLYLEYAPGESSEKIEASTLWTGAIALAAAWALTWTFFVSRVAVPELRHTLWSGVSGRQYVLNTFLKGHSDEKKFFIFACNRLLWEAELGEQVKAWVVERLDVWREGGETWFVEDEIPPEFMPEGGGEEDWGEEGGGEEVRQAALAA